MFQRVSLLVLAGLTLTSHVSAQIRAPRGTLSAQRNAPQVLIANPFTTQAADSAASVEIGTGIRERMDRSVLGRDYQAITRDRMNQALEQFGYAQDAILREVEARRLGTELSARMIVLGLIHKEDGLYEVTARLLMGGATTAAGHVVTKTQAPGQDLKKLGEEVADDFKPAVRAMSDANECYAQAPIDQGKAREAARKAISQVPNFGPAEYCLAELALAADSSSLEAQGHYQNVLKSDPLSTSAYSKLGVIYQVRGDSNKVVETYQQMLRLTPADEELRTTAFGLFTRYNRAGAAEEVADEGIQRDPDNVEWYDLKSGACLAQEKFDCAIAELERFYAIDSTRADTSFFKKITAAARFGGDTASFLKWAERGVQRFPDAPSTIGQAALAYVWSGRTEEAIATTRQLLAMNPDDFAPLRRLAAALSEQGQPELLIEFVPAVQASSDPDIKYSMAAVLVNAANQARSAQDTTAQLALGRATLETGADDPQFTTLAAFLVLERLYTQVVSQSQTIRENRSCTAAQDYVKILEELALVAPIASQSATEGIANFARQAIPVTTQELEAMRELVPSFCN